MNTQDKLDPQAFDHPLFLGEIERLLGKLSTAGGLLREYWADFGRTFMQDPRIRPQVIFLPAVLSGEGLDEARRHLADYVWSLEWSDTAGDVQYHTWCRCGAVTRRAAFFDWLACKGAWSHEEIERAARCFLGFAFKHPFAVLNARGRSSNNQALSMALDCAVIGFLFGYKLAQHPAGRFLFDYGVGRIPDLIGLFPEDGYGGEGSTYTSHVNTPLAYWTHELLRQVSGRDYLDTPFEPNGTTLRKLIEIELRITGPGGLLAPWDHYGWQRAINASPYAYLARVTHRPEYLSLIPSLELWPHAGYLAWGEDDPMWTLIWWPEEFKDYDRRELPEELFGWFLPKTGAALDDCKRRSRLMQVWDASGSSIASVGRAQVNPNHLMFDYGGEPVFEDGVQVADADPHRYPPEKVFETLSADERERYVAYVGSIAGVQAGLGKLAVSISQGLIGSSNSIVVDEEPWYWPGSSRVGRAEFYAAERQLQVVTADAASFYQPRYDIRLARRTSLWTGQGFGLVLDSVVAASPHLYRWQVYLRPEVELGGDSARVKLPGGKSVLIAWEAGAEVRTQLVEGFPQTEEKRSCRLDLVRRGRSAAFAVLIAPEAGCASVRRLGPHALEIVVDGAVHRFAVENFARGPVACASFSTDAIFAWKPPGHGAVEIDEGLIGPVKADVHELSDIESDRNLQRPEIAELIAWTCGRVLPDETCLSQIDACLAEIVQPEPDIGVVYRGLRSQRWPVQAAAAEAAGRCGMRETAPLLRDLLSAEHAKPKEEVYPPEDVKIEGRTPEDLGKRWRLKCALIVALGRLRDRDSVPLLGRILADGRDFYTVYSVAAQALGRIGGPDALDALGPAFRENEVNTRFRAGAARDAILAQTARANRHTP